MAATEQHALPSRAWKCSRTLAGSKISYALAAVALLLAVTCRAQLVPLTPLVVPTDGSDTDEPPPPCVGTTPGKIVLDKIVAFPAEGQPNVVVLRNVGGQTVNLTGWRLTDADTRPVAAANNYVFGQPPCDGPGNSTIAPAGVLTLTTKNDSNPCGFAFGISFRDEVNLFDNNGTLVASDKWNTSNRGAAYHLTPDGTYIQVPENGNVIDVLASTGMFTMFLAALKATGLDQALNASSNASYPGAPTSPPKYEKAIVPQFPWWFGFGVDRSKLPPPPPPPERPGPPPPGIPSQGPYTVFAPTDDAFTTLLKNLGNGKALPMDQLYALPELKDILTYHVLPGLYTSDRMFNNTPIYTAMSVDVVPFTDACMTEGKLMLHDNCVDKPTPDNYTCGEQLLFEKCYFPFMVSALASQWQGGFCQRTCQRCSCGAGSGIECATVVLPDLLATNGVAHGVSRVLFPPPKFDKAMYGNITVNITSTTDSTTAVGPSAPAPPTSMPIATPSAEGAASSGTAEEAAPPTVVQQSGP